MLTTHMKNKSKWIRILKVKAITTKCLEENRKKIFETWGQAKQSQDTKTLPIKEKNDKLDFIKIKTIYSLKVITKKMKTQTADWKKIFAKPVSDKNFLARIYKELLQLNKKKIQFKK